ncbi:copper homeostasis protein CutC [Membranihabitans maritimus]|uniref:copper homeostasis protein CutC n=1 Tax=Membranihabitans maritimus TaxID=2904244 RepID=UPI001F37326F|nr:copper homeostasis protein CutC [Membranihabitans maritimus]
MKIEIAANSFESALIADKAGVDRIELCANLELGGTTPTPGQLICVKDNLNIPVNALIRPRGGDFIYSELEFKEILESIRFCKQIGINGVVIGFLTIDGKVDLDKTLKAMEQAKGMDITFHRAFDQCMNQEKCLEDLITLGIPRVLTSGGQNSAPEGIKKINKLIELAGDDIIIMPGGGVNENNILDIETYTGAKEFHMSGKSEIKSPVEYRNKALELINKDDIHEYNYLRSNYEKILRIMDRINNRK